MRSLLKLFLFFTPFLGFSQTMNFSSYNVKDGLVQSNVKSICEDQFGNLWLATTGGLSRFDGINFTNFKKQAGLIDNRTLSVIEDSEGNIWTGTYTGFSKFDGKRFTNYLIDSTNQSKNMVTSIFEDSKGFIWVISNAGGINRFANDELVHFGQADGLTNELISAIEEDKAGTIWISTYTNGLYRYKNGKFRSITLPQAFRHVEIATLFIDSKNRMWIGTSGGLFKFENDNYQRVNDQLPLLNNFGVTAMEEDKYGNIWLATFTGVLKYSLPKNGRNGKLAVYNKAQGMTNNIVYDIHKDREGVLWFGTFGSGFYKSMGSTFYHLGTSHGLKEGHATTVEKVNGVYWLGSYGGGISKYVPADNSSDTTLIVNYSKESGAAEDYVFCSIVDEDKNIWFGTVFGLKKYDGKNFRTYTTNDGLISNWIYSAAKDSLGNLWFGTTDGLIKYNGIAFENFTIGKQEKDNWIRTVFALSNGQLLLGTLGGVYIYDGKNFNKFLRDTLRDKNIFAFAEDRINRRLWLGTLDEGLIRYDLPTGATTLFTEADGLTSDIIYSLMIGDDGSLFLGTQNGIDKLSIDRKGNIANIKNYNKNEGFTGIETNINAVYKEEDGSIWFGSIDGFFKYHQETDETNTLEPITHLTGLKLFYEEVAWNNYADSISNWYKIPFNLNLPYHQNHLSFEFIGHSLRSPKMVRYKYMLEEFDKNWSPVTSSTKAVYANLPPGEYTFKVVAANGDGVWNKNPVSYSFSIATPFWLTWWFFAILLILLVIFMKLYYDYRVRKKLKRLLALEKTKIEASEKVRKKVARDFHDEMGNHLVSISMLVQLVNNRLGSNGHGMSDLLRKLDQSSKSLFSGARDFIWAIDPKNDSLYATVIYIKDFGEDLFDKAKVNFYVQTNDIHKSEITLPPGWSRQIVLLFKEAITNCLKHSRCKNVYMDFKLVDKTFKVTLRDDGIGMRKTTRPGTGVGMMSMQTRAREMSSSISILSEEENGTEIFLELNLP